MKVCLCAVAAVCCVVLAAVLVPGCGRADTGPPERDVPVEKVPAPVSADPAAGLGGAVSAVPIAEERGLRKVGDGEAGLHNVFELAPGVWSGSMPYGEEGFGSLERLGVKTVVSVDGARPDIELARARGMQYVHIPIQYSGMEEVDRLAMAAALKSLPRPVYVHCHHGKHRGPAAIATGLIMLGEMTPEEGTVLLEEAGTSKGYPGLWRCVAMSGPVDASVLPAADSLPEFAEVSGMVAVMAAVDRGWDHLKLCEAAGWSAPEDHPDLVPAEEAGMVHDVLRSLEGHKDLEGYGEDFHGWMKEMIENIGKLEAAIIAGELEEATRLRALVDADCKACHKAYRDE